MKHNELKEQLARITKYRELEKIRNEIAAALKAVTEPWKDTGPCGQGPFTGNWRESREVRHMRIWFSETRGGAQAVDLQIGSMHISASELGRTLEAMLRAKLDVVDAEMAEI